MAEDCEQRRFGDLDRQEVDSENLGNFFVSHRTEEVHLGCLGLLWVDRRKAVQCLVNLEEPPGIRVGSELVASLAHELVAVGLCGRGFGV